MIQAIYYGAVAAFTGKTFMNLNEYYGAIYGALRGALDQVSGNLMYNKVVGGDANLKSHRRQKAYLHIALESLFAMVITGAACKLAEASKTALSHLSKVSIEPVSKGLSISAALSIEVRFTAAGLTLLQLKKWDEK